MAYQVWMEGWDRGDVGRQWVAYQGSALVINPTEGRRDTPCLEREYGPASDDWIRSPLFPAAPCTTLAFALYLTGNEQSIEFRLGYNWSRQIALKISNFGLFSLIDGAGTEYWASTTTLALNAWNFIELAVLCSATGSYELRVNGITAVYHIDVDTQYISGQTINSIYIGWDGPGDTGCRIDDLHFIYGSELAFFGDSRVDTLPLIANSDPVEWLPNPTGTPTADIYSLLNQDAGTINAVAVDQLAMFSPEELSSGAFFIWGVQVVSRAGKTDAGAAAMTLALRHDDTLAESDPIGLTTSKLTYWQTYQKNPITELDWNLAQIVNLEIGVKSVAP
jgi:hypothetical protein